MKFVQWLILLSTRATIVTLAGVILVASAFQVTLVVAQEQEPIAVPEDPQGQDEDRKIEPLTPEQLILYLANEKVVAPGLGFINGQLGDPMSYLLETWGEPLSTRSTGILGNTELMYQPDPDTLVVFSGKKTIDTISIKGNSASLIRTSRGARLGLKPLSIFQIYNRFEYKTKNNRIEFEQLGISFFVVKDKVDKIVIYPAKS
jgi:hypothetical protein